MKKVILSLISLIIFTSCKNVEYIVNDLPAEKLSFSQLPIVIGDVFMENLMPYDAGDGFTIAGGSKNQFVNKDTLGRRVEFKFVQGKSLMKSPERTIVVDGVSFKIYWNGNKINPPYIYSNNAIYYVESMYTSRKEDILSATYVKVDISKYLK